MTIAANGIQNPEMDKMGANNSSELRGGIPKPQMPGQSQGLESGRSKAMPEIGKGNLVDEAA